MRQSSFLIVCLVHIFSQVLADSFPKELQHKMTAATSIYLGLSHTVHHVTKESAPATFIAGAELETLLPLSELLSSQHSLCCCCTERSWRSHLAEYVL